MQLREEPQLQRDGRDGACVCRKHQEGPKRRHNGGVGACAQRLHRNAQEWKNQLRWFPGLSGGKEEDGCHGAWRQARQ